MRLKYVQLFPYSGYTLINNKLVVLESAQENTRTFYIFIPNVSISAIEIPI